MPDKQELEKSMKEGDVFKFLVNFFPLITIFCVVYGLIKGDLTYAYIFTLFTLFLLIITTRTYVNKLATGIISTYHPAYVIHSDIIHYTITTSAYK